jgi:DNA polymerase elongation subunit (family B)
MDWVDVFCPCDVPYAHAEYTSDERHQDPADKGSHMYAVSHSHWVDQMLVFANLRKTLGKRDSYALNAVAEEDLGVGKLEFGEGENIRNLVRRNFARFALYNAVDVCLLKALEDRNGDIDLLYAISIMTRTRVTKALKKTVCLRNLMAYFAREQGYAMSNNRNALRRQGEEDDKRAEERGAALVGARKGEEEEDEPLEGGDTKFRGAFVLDPSLNEPLGISVNGSPSSSIFEWVIDMDLASLYPSIMRAFNIDPSTQYGRLSIPKEKSPDGDEAFRFVDGFVSGDWLDLGKEWFGLSLPEELLEVSGE